MNHHNKIALLIMMSFCMASSIHAQSFEEQFYEFKHRNEDKYSAFRDECNRNYADFLRTAWDWYEGKAPMPKPKELNPVPPRPYNEKEGSEPIAIEPIEVSPIEDVPQPKPVEPIREQPSPTEDYFSISFYGITCKVRLPEIARLNINDCSPKSIAHTWEQLASDEMNNAIRDCLETRIRYQLCDWAFISFLEKLGKEFCTDSNGATMLTAFLFCQSGYQMRLAIDGNRLILLYGSRHQIYDMGYFEIDNTYFYPLSEPTNSIQICNASFEEEKPLSLAITSEQLLGDIMSSPRNIQSERFPDISVSSQTSTQLIDFFNIYPTSVLDNNPMTRWALYANTPLSKKTKESIYPSLSKAISGLSNESATNKLLNWVQTGFEYEYDDKVWGQDRAFFAEETLYYPYCDCEDRSILFSRLVRDLLGLDVALIYYPGHLATAVCFNEDVQGNAIVINGRKFIICDPTYIGAPVGAQMPDLDYDKIQAIVLKR